MKTREALRIAKVAAPSEDEFLQSFLRPRTPAIFTGLAETWGSLAKWTPTALAERYGECRVLAAPLDSGVLAEHPRHGVAFERVPLEAQVASQQQADPPGHYVMAPVANFPAEFMQEFQLPRYVSGARHLQIKVWIGKAGTITPLHRDVPHNLNVHLCGRKLWILVPPEQTALVYSRGLRDALPNFSWVDAENPDLTRHPLFAKARTYVAEVGPGETLFLPSGWWHYTRSLDDTTAMNFWWGGSGVALAAAVSRAFKWLRGIQRNEWA